MTHCQVRGRDSHSHRHWTPNAICAKNLPSSLVSWISVTLPRSRRMVSSLINSLSQTTPTRHAIIPTHASYDDFGTHCSTCTCVRALACVLHAHACLRAGASERASVCVCVCVRVLCISMCMRVRVDTYLISPAPLQAPPPPHSPLAPQLRKNPAHAWLH